MIAFDVKGYWMILRVAGCVFVILCVFMKAVCVCIHRVLPGLEIENICEEE